jgi:hypothetical protein
MRLNEILPLNVPHNNRNCILLSFSKCGLDIINKMNSFRSCVTIEMLDADG